MQRALALFLTVGLAACDSPPCLSGKPTEMPTVASFAAQPAIAGPGESVVLSWNVTGAKTISIAGIGNVCGTSITVKPQATTSYVLTATGRMSTVTAATMVLAPTQTDPSVLDTVAAAVSPDRLVTFVREASGVVPVTVNGETFSITERFSAAGKEHFRAYLVDAFEALDLTANVIEYPTHFGTLRGETSGHNVEVIIPGKSSDTVVLVTHYDSTGFSGGQTANPGADDNMTGMAQILEAARILNGYRGRLRRTVRLVAADYEEVSGGAIEGATRYAVDLQKQAAEQGFAIVAAIDPEESGWNCASNGWCPDEVGGHEIEMTACDFGIGIDDMGPLFDYAALENEMRSVAARVSPLKITRFCNGNISDHYPFAAMGIPAFFYGERFPLDNPFRDNQGDTFDTLDLDYFTGIARVGIAFVADLAGIDP